MIIVSSFNVNSINARLEIVTNYLTENNIDILMLQEIKCLNQNFPIDAFKKKGYQVIINGQKSYNGVAIISKHPIELISNNFYSTESLDKYQARFLDVKILDYRIICVYAPNGNPVESEKYEYKIKWYNQFKNYCKKLYNSNEKVIIGGDFNIIQQDIDCYNPKEWENDALFTPKVKKIFNEI